MTQPAAPLAEFSVADSDFYRRRGAHEDTVDGKSARSSYKKLALKVHPDKAPEELKARSILLAESVERGAGSGQDRAGQELPALPSLHPGSGQRGL